MIYGINTWVVGFIRYSVSITDWAIQDIKRTDIKTRKIMIKNGALHPRSSVGAFN